VSAANDRPGPGLRGTLTALVTPFDASGAIDWAAFQRQIDRQIEAGVDGLVPAGTTGESPTLTADERERVVAFVCEKVNRRVPVIAGVGTNATAESVRLAKHALQSGADAGMVVVPYYNRPGPQGIVDHYRSIWEESELPLMVYNIPSRTGTGLTPEVYDRLAGVNGVFSVKEASGDLNLASHLIAADYGFTVLAGDDALCVPMMAIGAAGVVSVASNLLPLEMKAMTEAMLRDDGHEARHIHRSLLRMFRTLFVETNPVPVKCAMRLLDLDSGMVRLPLTPASAATEEALRSQMQSLGMLGSDLEHYIDPRD
jgi:4-hydroxy-tetrahydrodipicolinate synthase